MRQTNASPTPSSEVNVAATCAATTKLGPGLRAVVWVQGCPFDCAGCIAPDWIPRRVARLVDPAALAAELTADPRITGLTLSGGEPMLQARALTETVRLVSPALTVVCFTGFRLEALRRAGNSLLAVVDVLIDGWYEADRDDGRGLRGSTNQRVHHLTDRLSGTGYDFTGRPRSAEIRIDGREALLVGIPPAGVAAAMDLLPARLGAGRPTGGRTP